MRCGLLPPTRYDFYPRPPRGGRPCSCRRRVPPAGISIHALREEGDPLQSPPCALLSNFYPRPPRGGRRGRTTRSIIAPNFYPRPPRGGRPAATLPSATLMTISIHALREEGDLSDFDCTELLLTFLSTPSARRATLVPARPMPAGWIFLSTPSARRATQLVCRFFREERISIHALREEGDLGAALLRLCHKIFLSTPSARRATHCSVQEQARGRISIHALREEGDRRFCRL